MAILTLSIDTLQKRVRRKELSSLVDPETWDRFVGSSDAFIEPLSGWGMLRPRPLYDAWYTSNTAPYDKLGISDYTGLTSASYQEFNRLGSSGASKFVTLVGSSYGETAITTASYAKNRGFYLGWFQYGEGSDQLYLQAGWDDAGSPSSGVRVDFYAGGSVYVYKDGVFVQKGSIGNVGQNQAREVLLIPWRKRELLVLCTTTRESFSAVFEDIEPTEEDPTITGAGKFWWKFPTATVEIQCAPLKYAESAYLLGTPTMWRRAPESGETLEGTAYYDEPFDGSTVTATVSAVQWDGSTAFTPNGTDTEVRCKVAFTGSGTSSPWLKGARMHYPGLTANTPNSPTVLDPYCVAAELSVPDNAADVSLTLTLKSPAEIESSGATKLRSVANRPIKASFGDYLLMDGRGESPHWDDATTDETRRYTLTVRDHWKRFERCIFDDPIPLDGLTVKEALELVCEYGGFYEFDIEDTETLIDDRGDDWGTLIEAGDTVAEWIVRILEGYAATWVYGFKPAPDGLGGNKIVFQAKSPEAIGTTPVFTLFATIAQATAYLTGTLGYSAEDAATYAHQYVYRNFKETVIEPEGNEVYVTGIDAAIGKPIVYFDRDEDAIDPTKSVADRPDNWSGEVDTIGYYDGGLRSDQAVSDALDVFAPRVMRTRRTTQWECELQFDNTGGSPVPAWKGQVGRLYFVDDTYLDYRVTAFEGSLNFEHEDGAQWRGVTYSGEEI